MKIIADLHIHSKYSRAVSQEMVLPQIENWAKKKGIGLVGTGDWTHPLWLREIKANLEEVVPGLYGLKNTAGEEAHSAFQRGAGPLFLLSTEISSIYSQGGKLHRIHNLVLAPSIETAEKINKSLVARGANLMSDGRPITGIPAPDLVKLILSVDENCLIIPAHVWTPWFSLYGSESGFDSLNECFGEMGKYIYAVETGLSSDPAMNWRIAELDSRQIVSCSDAHSGPKMGREATVFEIPANQQLSYQAIKQAIRQLSNETMKPSPKISYTIEFYPEEGKYHFTGHRDCKVCQSPEETKKFGETCPVCGKHLTIGVVHRVEQLSTINNLQLTINNDEYGVKWIGHKDRPPYAMLVPLQEILAESLESLPASQNVQNEYEKLVAGFGGIGEFGVLLKTSLEEIRKISGSKVAEGIKKVRSGEIVVEPGYDGVFGKVKIWSSSAKASEGEEEKEQLSLF